MSQQTYVQRSQIFKFFWSHFVSDPVAFPRICQCDFPKVIQWIGALYAIRLDPHARRYYFHQDHHAKNSWLSFAHYNML